MKFASLIECTYSMQVVYLYLGRIQGVYRVLYEVFRGVLGVYMAYIGDIWGV